MEEVNNKFIFDKIERHDLGALRVRNREIVKVWARLNGYLNIQFKYLLDNVGFAKELIELIGEDFSIKMEDTRKTMDKWNTPIELFIYRESGIEWNTIIIVDEFEIAVKSLKPNYQKSLKHIISTLNPKIIFLTLESTQSYRKSLLKLFTANSGYDNEELDSIDIGSSSFLNIDIH